MGAAQNLDRASSSTHPILASPGTPDMASSAAPVVTPAIVHGTTSTHNAATVHSMSQTSASALPPTTFPEPIDYLNSGDEAFLVIMLGALEPHCVRNRYKHLFTSKFRRRFHKVKVSSTPS